MENESDVEQKLIWSVLTGTEHLGIPSQQIRTKQYLVELPVGKGSTAKRYSPDYIVYSSGLPVGVVEAKSPHEAIHEGWRDARAYAFALNSRFKAHTNPVAVAIATNGTELIYGAWDCEEGTLLDVSDLALGDGGHAAFLKACHWGALKRAGENAQRKLSPRVYVRPTAYAGQVAIPVPTQGRKPSRSAHGSKGSLSHLHPQHLGATVLSALAERNAITTADVDDVIWSTSSQRGKQGGDLGRMSALLAGYEVMASGMTLDRFCGGGITSVNLAAGQIMSGLAECVIAGGAEMMSYNASLAAEEAAAGFPPLGIDGGNPNLTRMHPQSHQGVCADAIAAMEGITRADVDALGLESQKRAGAALKEGRFDVSLVAVKNLDGSVALDREEFPRPETTAEVLANLKASFDAVAEVSLSSDGTTFRQLIQRKYPDLAWTGVHHAGNSSGVVDGAAALLLASPAYAAKNGWKPRARVVMAANVGDCPTLMLNAPVTAARRVLQKAGLTIADIDLWEINEAFAVVAEKFIRDLGLDREKVNVNGGAIALGHPIGATGAILIGTVLDELERRDLRRGLVTMCAAGGMAPAIIIERV